MEQIPISVIDEIGNVFRVDIVVKNDEDGHLKHLDIEVLLRNPSVRPIVSITTF